MGVEGYNFAVWAPDAKSVRVIGEFNDWNQEATYLEPTKTGGIWRGFIEGVQEGQLYKYLIETPNGDLLYKADPYMIFLVIPVEGIIKIVKEFEGIGENTTIVDLGSTKQKIIEAVPESIRQNFMPPSSPAPL